MCPSICCGYCGAQAHVDRAPTLGSVWSVTVCSGCGHLLAIPTDPHSAYLPSVSLHDGEE